MAVKFDPNTHKIVSIQPNNNVKQKKETSMFGAEPSQGNTQTTESDLCRANYKSTDDGIDKELKDLFEPICKEYNLEYSKEFILSLIKQINSKYSSDSDSESFKHLAVCLRDAFEKHYDKVTKTLDLNKALKTAQHKLLISNSKLSEEDLKNKPKDIASVISTQYASTHNDEKVDFNKLSTEEKKAYIKEYFESKLKEYMAKPDMTEEKAQQLLLLDFETLVSNTTDDEKHLLLETAAEVFKSPEAVKLLFDSFEDKNKAIQLADSVSLEYLEHLDSIDSSSSEEIVKHMSAEKIIEYLQKSNESFNEFYQANKEAIDRVIDKVQRGEELSEEEQGIKTKLDSYEELRNILITGARENVYMSQDAKKKIELKIKEIEDKQPSKLREYKEFCEAEKSAKEKSATDETGKFKTASEEVIDKSKEKIQAIKQSIEDASNPKPIVAEAKNSKGESADTSDTSVINYDTITGDDGTDIIKDIFTGKIKVSEYLEQVAIKKYKLMNTAMQGNILLNATGKFFNDLVQNLETSTFEHLLSIGWKGRSFYATEQVKNEVEERKNDVA